MSARIIQLVSTLGIGILPLLSALGNDYPNLDLPVNSINPNDQVRAVSKGLFPGNTAQAATARKLSLPAIFSPDQPRMTYTSYPWKNDIQTTIFWVGEKATRNNPVPNSASSWDTKWSKSFGGYDDPDPKARNGYLPKKFMPKQNPFYFALPYNDVGLMSTKDSAKKYIPWFQEAFYREGRSVLKGRWIAIRYRDRVCYGQWEDCGPFETDNWEYVFRDSRPRTKGNGGAGLDVSPAIRDYLGFRGNVKCDWRFVDLHEIPEGPWKKWGHNNPFALRFDGENKSDVTASERLNKLRELRDVYMATVDSKDVGKR